MSRDIDREMESDEMYAQHWLDAQPTARPRDDETREELGNGNSRARVLPCY